MKYTNWRKILDTIDGYMSSRMQREVMFDLGAGISSGIELGTHKGLSACIVAAGMKSAGSGRVLYCVDTYESLGADLDALAVFEANARRCGVWDICFPVVMDTRDSPSYFSTRGVMDVEYLYVDADHSEESVLADCIGHLPFLKQGAAVLFHDYDGNHWPEVVMAVDFLENQGLIMKTGIVDDCWIGVKT